MLAVLDDFIRMWSAKERSRDGLVPGSFDDDGARQLLRQASTARALCIAAVVELTVLLFVASWLPAAAVTALWVLFALTVVVAIVVAARSLSALAQIERRDGGRETDAMAPEDHGSD